MWRTLKTLIWSKKQCVNFNVIAFEQSADSVLFQKELNMEKDRQ